MLTVNAVEVQKHRLRGPVGYTVVGSPTIVDGVVSGFSANDYLNIPNFKDDGKDLEFKVTFITTDVLGNKPITGSTVSWSKSSLFATTDIGKHLSFRISEGVHLICDNIDLTLNTKYSAILQRQGNLYSLFVYSNDVLLDTKTLTSDLLLFNGGNAPVQLGYDTTLYGSSFDGSIDLNQTYIKVNGKLWFYQPADTKYIVKDGKLVWADPRLALSGPVGYEVVGSPTIVDGVVSGFSGSDYLRTPVFNPGNNTWELGVKIKYKQKSENNYILGGTSSFLIKCWDDRLGMSIKESGSSAWNYNGVASYKISEDEIIWVRLIFDGSSYKLSYSSDGVTYTELLSYISVNNIGTDAITIGKPSNDFFTGSIDLNQTYIKVNDQLWFYGKNYATQNIAPVPAGYTFGTTTTPSIGYVDMRTQQFTAAPTGATIGRDE